MAFTSPTARNSNAPANDNWKAQGFLNLYLPTKEGKRRKLGTIPLRDTKDAEKTLRTWIEKDPEAAAKVLLSKLIVEYQSAEASDGAAFDLEE